MFNKGLLVAIVAGLLALVVSVSAFIEWRKRSQTSDWAEDWIKNPEKYMPGTKMPHWEQSITKR